MSLFEYVTLIETGNTDPAAWASARKGNPNTPEGALKNAIEHVATDDVVELIMKLTDTPPASEPVDGEAESRYDIQVRADANGWYDGKMESLAEIKQLEAELTQLRQQLADTQSQLRAARVVLTHIAQPTKPERREHWRVYGADTNHVVDEYIRIAQDGLDAMAKATPQPSPAVNSELVEALFDDRLGVTGYEWLRAMKSTAEAAKDTEYAKKDIDAYYLMLRECEAVFKVMDKAAAALKAAGEGS